MELVINGTFTALIFTSGNKLLGFYCGGGYPNFPIYPGISLGGRIGCYYRTVYIYFERVSTVPGSSRGTVRGSNRPALIAALAPVGPHHRVFNLFPFTSKQRFFL
jgi:hypothetical protein